MMITSISLYFKYQTTYLIYLFSLFVIPLGLFFKFSPYQLPKVQYVVLALLYVTQVYFFKEIVYRNRLVKKLKISMERELKRTPSEKEIYSRCYSILRLRGVSIILSGLGILTLMILFQQF